MGFDLTILQCTNFASKIYLSPPPLVASAAVCSKAVVPLLLNFIAVLIVCGDFVFGLCFVMQYFMSFFGWQSSQ